MEHVGTKSCRDHPAINIFISLVTYVPSHLNSSDISTRSISLHKFIESSWYTGPSFLLDSMCVWPEQKVYSSHSSVEEEKVCTALVNNIQSVEIGIGKVVDCQRYGSFGKFYG